MKKKLREKIIRRLGGVPVWLFGYFPYMKKSWELRLLECKLEQRLYGHDIMELKYEVIRPEDKLKQEISAQAFIEEKILPREGKK